MEGNRWCSIWSFRPPMKTEISDPPLMLRLIRTRRRRKSGFNLGETSGMPTWLGAKDEPMYRPKTASCTARNATAFSGGRMRNTRQTIDNQRGYAFTTVRLRPDRAGTFGFACGMNMVHGILVVDPADETGTGTAVEPVTARLGAPGG